MGRRRRLFTSILAVAALALTALLVGGGVPAAADDFATMGRFQTIFAEDPAFVAKPPATVEESTRTPTASSIAALPVRSNDLHYVFWNGLENLESDTFPLALDATRVSPGSKARRMSLALSETGSVVATFTPTNPETGGTGKTEDLFCADQRILLDGSVMAAGGTRWTFDPVDLTPVTGAGGPGGTAELFGSDLTRIYSPGGTSGGGTWAYTDKMSHGRWYPTLLTLPDGKMFVASGVHRLLYNHREDALAAGDLPTFLTKSQTNVHETETFDPYNALGEYDPANGTWTENGESGEVSLPLFARLHLLHNGKVLFPSDGQMWGPFGQGYDEALWNVMKWYDPATKSWTDVGTGPFGAVNGAASILLPFKPNADGTFTKSQILLAGGTLGTSPGGWLARNFSQIITAEDGQDVKAERGPDLVNDRWYSSGVIAPTGEVFILNGADKDEVVLPGIENPVRQVEVYDPATNTFKGLAAGTRDRTYHNSAILMADGRILIGGHAPINLLYGGGDYGADDPTTGAELNSNSLHAATGLFAHNLKDPAFEIYEPPYLFRGPRPELPDLGNALFEWGTERTIALPGSTDVSKIIGAVLVKMPAATHVTDADMRMIELQFTKGTNQITVKVPSDRDVAVPGHYYLFVLADNGEGPTPSKAAAIRVGNEAVFSGVGNISQAKIGDPQAAVSKPAAKPVTATAIIAEAPAAAPVRRPGGTLPIAIVIGAAALGSVGAALRRPRRATT